MNIEELIKRRKDKLDVENTPPEVWGDIQKEWKKESPRKHLLWQVAAVIFIVTSIGLLSQNIILQNKVEDLASLGDISEKYSEIEKNYQKEIDQIESSISIIQVKKQEDFSWIFNELTALDEVNEIYRQDIGKANEEQLVSVLIDYYEKKLRLLKKLEFEIKRTNKLKNDEKINTDSISI
ncbi:hypothetical protein [Ekhidna sp.]